MLHIIWDLDGTLIDSKKEIIDCILLAIKDAGREIAGIEKLLKVGPKIDVMLRNAFGEQGLSKEELEAIIGHYRLRYDNCEFENTRPYSGIEKILFDTRSFVHHIVTNKPDLAANRIITKLGWAEYITSIDTPYSGCNSILTGRISRSKTEIFEAVISRYSGEKALFCAVGDMPEEILAAKANGILSIGVLWGYSSVEQFSICNSDFVVNTINELNALLLGMCDE